MFTNRQNGTSNHDGFRIEGYLISTVMEIKQLWECVGKNGGAHSNFLLWGREFGMHNRRKHFFYIVVERNYGTFTLRLQMCPTREKIRLFTVYDVTMKQLDGHFAPQVNSAYERHLFRAM